MSVSMSDLKAAGVRTFVLLALVSACGGPPAGLPDEIREGVPYTLAGTFQVEPGRVRIVAWEEAVWPDACLGIPMRGACAEGDVPGYRLVVDVEGMRYEYRAPTSDPLALLLAAWSWFCACAAPKPSRPAATTIAIRFI